MAKPLKLLQFYLLFLLFLVSDSFAFVPPIEFLVEEWARVGHINTPLHLQFEGAFMLQGQSNPVQLTQDWFVLPTGHFRLDTKIKETTLTYIRNNDRCLLLSGKSPIPNTPCSQSLRILDVLYPPSKEALMARLEALSLFRADVWKQIREEKLSPASSVELRSLIKQSMYGTQGRVALALPAEGSRTVLIDKATLFPVTLSSGSASLDVHELMLAEIPPAFLALPASTTLHHEQNHLHLRLKSNNTAATLSAPLLSVESVLKSLGKKDSANLDDTAQALSECLARFF